MCLFEDYPQDPKSIYINQYKIEKDINFTNITFKITHISQTKKMYKLTKLLHYLYKFTKILFTLRIIFLGIITDNPPVV